MLSQHFGTWKASSTKWLENISTVMWSNVQIENMLSLVEEEQ
jgi:hypothetical protein